MTARLRTFAASLLLLTAACTPGAVAMSVGQEEAPRPPDCTITDRTAASKAA